MQFNEGKNKAPNKTTISKNRNVEKLEIICQNEKSMTIIIKRVNSHQLFLFSSSILLLLKRSIKIQ